MGQTFDEVKDLLSKNFSKFFIFLALQTFIQLILVFSESLGILPGTGTDVWIQILVGLLTVWNFCYLVQVVQDIRLSKTTDFTDKVLDATYDSFSFFLYSLLYGITVLVGGLFFLIPGIYFLIFHYFTPFVAILEPDMNLGDNSYLSYSRKIVKDHWGKVVALLFIMILLNLVVVGLTSIPGIEDFRLIIKGLLAPLDAVLILISDLLGIYLFHYLCKEYRLKVENQL